MPPHMHSPVQVQAPFAVHDGGVHGKGVNPGGHMGNICNRQVGRRRIFVQTDNGNVLGIELDRADKVESVKKKVQAALCVPTEQSALVFGDHVLDKDLSEVRNDAPLLLTRGLHRSSSTPCLSPTASDVVKSRDWSRPFEIVGGLSCSSSIKRLLRETVKAIECGVQPLTAGGGLGGAYYFRNRRGENIAIVKPTDEEPFAPNNPKGFVGKMLGQPGLKRSIRVGETGVREVAAFLLDHQRFARVPPTALVKAAHPIFNVNTDSMTMIFDGSVGSKAKIGSFQQYVQHDFDASEHGTSRFPVSAVHRIGILDVRILNTDRHAGNILVRKRGSDDMKGGGTWDMSGLRVDDSAELIPIDHGLSLPESLEDPYFEWLHWPQASFPFSDEELRYIAALDPVKDVDMLRKELPMLRESCLRILVICTMFLQIGAAAGLTLAEIGGMMSRELSGMDEEPSELQTVCVMSKMEMQRALAEPSSDEEDYEEDSDDENQFEFDGLYEEEESVNGRAWFDFADAGREQGRENSARTLRSPLSGGGYYSIFASPHSPMQQHGCRGGLPSLLLLQEMHPLDEDSDVPFSPLGRNEDVAFPTTPDSPFPSASFNNGAAYLSSRCSGPPRSVSLNNSTHKKTRRPMRSSRGVGMGGAFLKVHEAASASAPFCLAELNDKSWLCFLAHFRALLPSAISKRKGDSLRSLQRFGSSCQF